VTTSIAKVPSLCAFAFASDNSYRCLLQEAHGWQEGTRGYRKPEAGRPERALVALLRAFDAEDSVVLRVKQKSKVFGTERNKLRARIQVSQQTIDMGC
jgi:hypothetical protein